jgi:hypothetical protein
MKLTYSTLSSTPLPPQTEMQRVTALVYENVEFQTFCLREHKYKYADILYVRNRIFQTKTFL